MTFAPLGRVDIDGLNLALEEGTGVATYARNLSIALGELGYEVGVLYGRPAGGGKDDLLQEVTFFDSLEERPNRWAQAFGDARSVVKAVGGLSARQVKVSGAVIADNLKARLPHFDKLMNVRRLFQVANSYFDLFGRRLCVHVPDPPRLMHWTYPVPIKIVGAKNIYTLHDLVPLRLPYTTLDRKRRYLKLCRLLAAEADHLVTVSEASKRDILDLLRVTPQRVTNTYESVDIPAAVVQRAEDEVRAEVEGVFGLQHKGYFLFFGAIEPKKNVNRLIQAYLAANVETPLVLAGKRAWKSQQELRLLEIDDLRTDRANQAPRGSNARVHGNGVEAASEPAQLLSRSTSGRRVIQIDYVPFSLLMSLVGGAKAVLFPSLYEGFGLPVLEAMTLGTPVLTSTTSSLPEVAGEAALLVNPYDPQSLTEAIRRLDTDAELRADLSIRGVAQAATFSRQAYKSRLAALYEGLGLSS